MTSLCREWDALREEARRHSPDRVQLLDRIAAEAKARRPVLDLISGLLGTDNDTTLRALGAGLPGAGPGRATAERFGCPDGACDRIDVPPPAGALPRCRVTGLPMERM
ncbi:hypothetical protein [Amycolatopsis sp. Hca4]|uniref:hypothetical protein n=1 Tax=unclassified Amycolatopsis TaxID=2618356 RepID=UPI0020CAC5C3|nr:hypothetical protein [Amycolatopsis sp. Hca4]